MSHSYWNYRIREIEHKGQKRYGIHEVFYEDGELHSWTKNPTNGYFDSIKELKEDLLYQNMALKKSPVVLDEKAPLTKKGIGRARRLEKELQEAINQKPYTNIDNLIND